MPALARWSRSADEPENTTGGHRRFFSEVSSRVASMYPTVDALHGITPTVTYSRLIRASSKSGRGTVARTPHAVQSMYNSPGFVGREPSSSVTSVALIRRTRPRRTTFSIWRPCSSSRRLMVEPRNMVGSRASSNRRNTPLASSRCAKSVASAACAAALDPLRLELHVPGSQEVERLGERTVEHPPVARLDPPDRVGCDPGVQEPAARVHRRLARADHRESARRLAEVNEPVRRHEADAFVDLEAGRVHRRYLRLDVRRVDELLSDLHRRRRAVQQRHHVVTVAVLSPILRHGHEPDPARRHELFLEDAVVVVADLRCRGALIEARIGAGLVDAVRPQDARVHAVVRRRLVQPDERVRVEPVTAGAMPPVDEHDLGVRIAQQRVHERHPRRPRPDDEVIGLQLVHAGPLGGDRRTRRRRHMMPDRPGRRTVPSGRAGPDRPFRRGGQ